MSARTKQAPTPPPLYIRQRPGLSETLEGLKHPGRCQSCGGRHVQENPLSRWVECDAWDRVPELGVTVVVLCRTCSERLIEPHPRLYHMLWPNEPFPGCMSVCLGCRHRDGVVCAHPAAKRNGGPGVTVTIARPTTTHLCYAGGRGETRNVFSAPASSCADKEPST